MTSSTQDTSNHPKVAQVRSALRAAGVDREITVLPESAPTAALARAAGAVQVGRAGAAFVREHTDQAIGGVAPVGHPAPIRTFVDTRLAEHDRVWAAAGHPHTVFATTFDELVRVTGGTPVDVAG
ncbi:prolyl-tRNA editing enzyme YbaK/EbsC (Cys-tRNA(Pro) deacylase) [Haloactinopolyspora alba]|uniref:Prolyl-tRNA editing enzyme YbaK/EbsC (Cys-tRNA(Pro) deacylase) n=1 Tax=Haloactinopolyspora alba TaxID=648780 RepID=A0A2P8E2F4_9ACTN|nr:YbaK/EbsC family protein [Haloactinopolyspora alba]PSL03655.1 prolyl-tRNA editing enzyme YbaK/EbsC (Cys-tRNA(Pro) deacylase) [Haloactinopolyspora alba]